MVTIATCKPRNPFSGLFRREYEMLENEKRAPAGGCSFMSYCSTHANCIEDRGYFITPGNCGPSTVCCTYYEGFEW
ncbi:hypothetical protein ACROYT_G037187 [Oculina patagonica]